MRERERDSERERKKERQPERERGRGGGGEREEREKRKSKTKHQIPSVKASSWKPSCNSWTAFQSDSVLREPLPTIILL